jgi:hypothetical protein
MDADAIAHDINGEFYVVGQQGEIETLDDHRKLYLRTSDSGNFGFARPLNVNTNEEKAAVVRAIQANYWGLVHAGSYTDNNVRPSAVSAMRIAYLRVVALVKGFIDVTGTPAAHNVRYTDVELIPDGYVYPEIPIGPNQTPAHANNAVVPGFAADQAWRNSVNAKVLNMVCLVAFFMRARGHHWTVETQEKYVNIWHRCLYDEDNPGLDWMYIAHHAFHCIFPDNLDYIWTVAVENSRCAGALIKRYDVFSAGTAALGAIEAGRRDLDLVFPAIRNLLEDAYLELDRCLAFLQAHRWNGSINRRFYGGDALRVNEKLLGSLAAVILGGLALGDGASPLRQSAALRRVATNAPITGALITALLTKAAQDDRMVRNLFIEEAPEA